MKVLYVGTNSDKIKSGLDVVNSRNLNLLSRIISKQNLFIYDRFDVIESSKMILLQGYMGGLNRKHVKNMLNIIEDEKIECIFLSHSLYGKACKKIKVKYPNIKIICFFHNIEQQYAEQYLKVNGLRHLPFYYLVKYNETKSVEYADYHIVLNNRDSLLLNSTYNIDSSMIMPVTYNDVFDEARVISKKIEPLTLLFVGTAFFANLEAVRFFITKVLPKIDAKLIIIGKGMDEYKEEFLRYSDNIEVYGFVEDLDEYYYDCSAVIAPIFSGGGMKTKIAEALMYGKTVIGTTEAFQGYEIDKNCMILCNSDEEFINFFNHFEETIMNKSFNTHSRDVFKRYYDSNTILEKFKAFLSQI
ncbi:glycosyltransferase [Psychrobacter maritimus]|uniref:glycosyltransferase n=1 Tax=Psychrobacter maritimus TaxID=256325 RepID=UPI00356AE8BA